ncbi:MAG TPA: YwiC-like family protein [Gaiellaceae bacterium]|jgi:Flp pilus assembly protein TadB
MNKSNGRDPSRRVSKRPYRDSALIYGAFAVIVIIVAVLTGGRVLWAVVLAVGAFLFAMLWTWRSLRGRQGQRSQ